MPPPKLKKMGTPQVAEGRSQYDRNCADPLPTLLDIKRIESVAKALSIMSSRNGIRGTLTANLEAQSMNKWISN